jgi:hypothetical protein
VTPQRLPEAYTKAEKSINGLIDSSITDLQQLKVRHNEYIDKHVSSYRKFEQLRQKLLNGQPMNAGEATGDTVAKMLKEIEEESSMGNPYCLSGAEVEQCIEDIRQRMANIKMSIEALWTDSPIKEVEKSPIKVIEKPSINTVEKSSPTVEVRNHTVTVSDLASVSSTVIAVCFIGCRSKEWRQVGERLATLPTIITLTVEHCDSEDSLCTGICSSKSLASVRMSK